MTQQELGLHLIARYLLAPTTLYMFISSPINRLREVHGIERIPNLSMGNRDGYMLYPFYVCQNCYSCTKEPSDTLCRSACGNCSRELGVISYNTFITSDNINRDLAFFPYEYKLKLVEILWQTQLRKLL